jgi:hypothetical protein
MAVTDLNEEHITEFWKWFTYHCNELSADLNNESLLDELDEEISGLGDLAWEIGPGVIASNQLVISPGGDSDLLQLTEKIVSVAPELDDWEFYYAKQPKQWDLEFEFQTEYGNEIVINGSKWKYVLLKYPDGVFEIIIKPDVKINCSEDDKLVASEILLDGILGEEKRVRLICNIDVVERFDDQYLSKVNEIGYLSEHLDSLT